MPKFIIERSIPNVDKLPASELRAIAMKSRALMQEIGDMQWQETFVTADKLYCVYVATNPELIREHGRRGGFPVDTVHRVLQVIDPTTAE
jgi:hypothetical protein